MIEFEPFGSLLTQREIRDLTSRCSHLGGKSLVPLPRERKTLYLEVSAAAIEQVKIVNGELCFCGDRGFLERHKRLRDASCDQITFRFLARMILIVSVLLSVGLAVCMVVSPHAAALRWNLAAVLVMGALALAVESVARSWFSSLVLRLATPVIPGDPLFHLLEMEADHLQEHGLRCECGWSIASQWLANGTCHQTSQHHSGSGPRHRSSWSSLTSLHTSVGLRAET